MLDGLNESSGTVSELGVNEQKLSDLRNLNAGDVIEKQTSYLGEQNEVRDMVSYTAGEKHWPGYWYELLQGAWDYNNWEKGPPTIDIYYVGQLNPVSLAQFTEDFRRHKKPRIERVVIANHIKGESGLRPNNLYLTRHQQKDDLRSLGAHGRGLKIAATATMAGGLAERITFESYIPEVGAWHGEAGVAKDEIDPDTPESMQFRYKRDTSLVLERTQIAVYSPNEALCEALAELPNWFLPANPNYRFFKLEDGVGERHSNLATVFASERQTSTNKTAENETTDGFFTPYELSYCGHDGLEKAASNEPARVEILKPDIIPNKSGEIDFVFIDGLRVEVPGTNFSHIYSFWGWSQGTSAGYNPKRSNDSLKMENHPRYLLEKAMCRCENPVVFSIILKNAINRFGSYENDFYRFNLDEIRRYPQAIAALISGWDLVKSELNISNDTYVTNNTESYERAETEGKKCVHIHSTGWLTTLVNFVPGVVTVDSVFEEEDRIRREASLRLQKELEREKKEAAQREEAAVAAAKEQWLKERRIVTEAKFTGEIIKLNAADHSSDRLAMARLHLIHALAEQGGRIIDDPRENVLVLEMRADLFSRLPRNSNDFGYLGDFIKNYVSVYGLEADFELRVVKNGNGNYFKFALDPHEDEFGNQTIQVEAGKIEADGQSFIRIECVPFEQNSAVTTTDDSNLSLQEYHNSIRAIIAELVGEDGTIDPEKYLTSQYHADYPPAMEVIRTRRQAAELAEETLKALQLVNKLRTEAGLPPLQDPNAQSESSPNGAKTSGFLSARLAPIYRPDSDGASPGRREVRVIDGDPVYERILNLLFPNQRTTLATRSKERRGPRIIIGDHLTEVLKREVSPDMTLASGEIDKVGGYLVSHIEPDSSDITNEDYRVLPEIPFENRPGKPCLRFNKPIPPGLHSLFCPPGFKPIAFFHDSEFTEIKLSGIPEIGVYSFYHSEKITSGLKIYFEKRDQVDNTTPTPKERRVNCNFERLLPHWKNLIEALNLAELTDKQKHDILIRAWTKAFNYDSTQDTFDLYEEYRDAPLALAAEIINHAKGNCGYAEYGFHGLASLVNIPYRTLVSALSNNDGNFNMGGSLHSMSQTYLDGEWVYVEPQWGYLTGRDIEPIPEKYQSQFDDLLDAIPDRFTENLELAGGPKMLAEVLPPIRPLRSDLGEAAEVIFMTKFPRLAKLRGDVRRAFVRLDEVARAERTKRYALRTAKASVLATGFGFAGKGAAHFAPEISEVLAKVKIEVQRPDVSITPGDILPKINVNFGNVDPGAVEQLTKVLEKADNLVEILANLPPEYWIIACMLGLAVSSFMVGIAYERNKHEH